MAPLVDGVRIDRSAHLLRADGLNDPAVVVEAQAFIFIRQSAVIKQAAYLAFWIGDSIGLTTMLAIVAGLCLITLPLAAILKPGLDPARS